MQAYQGFLIVAGVEYICFVMCKDGISISVIRSLLVAHIMVWIIGLLSIFAPGAQWVIIKSFSTFTDNSPPNTPTLKSCLKDEIMFDTDGHATMTLPTPSVPKYKSF